ncbi:MAG: hypothetical protein U0800_23465 [Isosphaeraceae bacterium]
MIRDQELEVLKSGRLQSRKADNKEAPAKKIGTTATVLGRIRLVAVVKQVTNPSVVSEVYVKQEGR